MARPRSKIEIGKEYGWLTVLAPAEKDCSGHLMWKVRCRCGNEYVVPTGILNKGSSKCRECGNRYRKAKKRLAAPGDVINGFEVLANAGKNKHGGYLYTCKCPRCGNVSVRTYSDMISRKGAGCANCRPDYHFRINGDVAEGHLPDGTAFKIDADMVDSFCEFNWTSKEGYIRRNSMNLPKIRLHRFVLGLNESDEQIVDHINRDRSDCRRANLRIVTASQNAMNHSMFSTNSSGYTGVSWNKGKQKWRAYIVVSDKHLYLGYFDDKVSAAQCYNFACKLMRGRYAGELNDVPDPPLNLKISVYKKCLPYINTKMTAAAKAVSF